MRRLRFMMLLATCVLGGACRNKDAPDKSKEIAPQARPVFTFITAVKSGDQDQLKAAFSERMQTELDADGWDEVMNTYQQIFEREFGDYKVEEFTFEFTGNETAGQVSVVHNGRELPGLQVIKEKAGWKMSER